MVFQLIVRLNFSVISRRTCSGVFAARLMNCKNRVSEYWFVPLGLPRFRVIGINYD